MKQCLLADDAPGHHCRERFGKKRVQRKLTILILINERQRSEICCLGHHVGENEPS